MMLISTLIGKSLLSSLIYRDKLELWRDRPPHPITPPSLPQSWILAPYLPGDQRSAYQLLADDTSGVLRWFKGKRTTRDNPCSTGAGQRLPRQ